ncbi:Uncharacterised protein [Mycobacteroides abscessus subsp. abscessus]|nr:Uncharacterised protein [Mycobacteroides abscessus subsp. abscessus]
MSCSTPVPTYPSSPRVSRLPENSMASVSTSSPCSNPASTSNRAVLCGSSSNSAPSSGVAVRTGDTCPANVPRNTRRLTPPATTASGA